MAIVKASTHRSKGAPQLKSMVMPNCLIILWHCLTIPVCSKKYGHDT